MRVRYDEDADALYIRVHDGQYDESAENGQGVILDYDVDGNIIGIGILKAVAHFAPADLRTVNSEIGRPLAKPGNRGQ